MPSRMFNQCTVLLTKTVLLLSGSTLLQRCLSNSTKHSNYSLLFAKQVRLQLEQQIEAFELQILIKKQHYNFECLSFIKLTEFYPLQIYFVKVKILVHCFHLHSFFPTKNSYYLKSV